MTDQTPEPEQTAESESLGTAIQNQIFVATAVALCIAAVVYGLYMLQLNQVILIAGSVSAVGVGMVLLVHRYGVRSVAVSSLLLWGGFAVAAVVRYGGGNG